MTKMIRMSDLDTAELIVRVDEAQTEAGIMVALLGLLLGTRAFISNFMVKLI